MQLSNQSFLLGRYLATGGADAQIRPWFWIVLFFFSTSTRDTLIQWLTFNYVSSVSFSRAHISWCPTLTKVPMR